MLGYQVSKVIRNKFGEKLSWVKLSDSLLPYWFKLLTYFMYNILIYDWRFGRNWFCKKLVNGVKNE